MLFYTLSRRTDTSVITQGTSIIGGISAHVGRRTTQAGARSWRRVTALISGSRHAAPPKYFSRGVVPWRAGHEEIGASAVAGVIADGRPHVDSRRSGGRARQRVAVVDVALWMQEVYR